jgi:hypothetical protein
MIGELLDGWKLTKELGEGSTGETYLAEREETGERAAAKVLSAAASADRALLDKLFADTRAASRVNHVGMVDVLACGVHGGGRAYLVMELLEGKTLTDALIDLGAVADVESFADIGWQLATLLGAAHAAKLVHGALKPDGIFLTFPPAQAPRPLVKVLDFGMAKFATSVRHSQTGSLLGAPLYMSPEVGRGLGSVDHRADIYSLGCILFEMLCGRPPFVREGAGELVIAHTTETPPSVSSLEPAVALGIDNLIGRMLTKNPAVRPQSMAEVAGVLEKFFQCPAPGAGAAMAAPPPSPGPAPRLESLAAPPPPALPAAVPVSATVDIGSPTPPAVIAARRPDPTALLPPDDPVAQAGMAARPPAAQTWVARVRQCTAILEPAWPRGQLGRAPRGRPQGGSRGIPAKQPRRRPSGAVAAPGARLGSGLNLPVVIATASIVLAIGAALLLLRTRKPAPSAPPPPPSSQRAPVRPEPFQPPPPPESSPAPAPPRPEPPAAVEAPEALPPVATKPLPASTPRTPEKRGPAKRW